MTYSEYFQTFTTTSKRKTLDQCVAALRDCHATMALWGQDISTDYSTRLWAEIDALRDRLRTLQNTKTGSHYDYTPSWHTRSNGQPLDTEE